MGTAGHLVPTVGIDDFIVQGVIVLLLINNSLVTVVVVCGTHGTCSHYEKSLTW